MINIYNIISLFVLGPFLFYPFSFCPFRLPYLYCFICPVRCLGYRLRGVALLIAVGLNVRKGSFCNYICPLGTIQTLLFKINTKKLSIPGFFRSFKYAGVLLIVFIIVATKKSQAQLFIVKLKDLLLTAFLLTMAISIFNYRIFCRTLCPVKALNEVSNSLLKKRN